MPDHPSYTSLLSIIHPQSIIKNTIRYAFYVYLRLLFSTYRLIVTCDYECNLKEFNKNQGIFYCWHQNIIPVMFFLHKHKVCSHSMVNSYNHHLTSFCAAKLGFKTIDEGTYKSRASLLRETLDILDINKRLCVVGDGPHGPAFRLQRGIAYLAKKSQVPLIFIECQSQWHLLFHKHLNRFAIPLPFSKIHIRLHRPYQPKTTHQSSSCTHRFAS